MSYQDISRHTLPSRTFVGVAIAAVLVAILTACFVNMPDDNQQATSTVPSAPPANNYPRELALRNEVPAGSNVWTVVSDHVRRYDPSMTPQEHEREVLRMVQRLQLYIHLDLRQPVRDVNVVPVGYAFYTSPSGIISPSSIPS